MSNPLNNNDGIVRRGLDDAKIENARRFLYEEDESFSTVGDDNPVPASPDFKSNRKSLGYAKRSSKGSTDLGIGSGGDNDASTRSNRGVNTLKYHAQNKKVVRNKNQRIVIGTVVAAAIIVGVWWVGSQNKRKRDQTLGGKGGSTSNTSQTSKRLGKFQDLIARNGISALADLETEGSPQNLAANWLAHEDEAKLKTDDHNALHRYALAVLYYGTNPDFVWGTEDGWLSKQGFCAWAGVTCREDLAADAKPSNKNGEIHSLKLPENGLDGSLPSELSALEELYELDLSHNQLVGHLPKVWGNALTSLRILSLHQNNLSGTIPKEVLEGRLGQQLRELDLSENYFKGTIPGQIEHLVDLRSLKLDHNKLTGSVPDLEDLTKLRELTLQENDLQGEFPSSLWHLTSLVEVNLGQNHITGTLPSELDHLTALEKLLLHEMNLRGSIPEEIFLRVTRLTELSLSQNKLTGEIPSTIGHLRDLHGLYLGDNKLGGELPEQMVLLADLRMLELHGNDLQGTIPRMIQALGGLHHLSLGRNSFAGSLPSELGNLHRLENLFVEDNALVGPIPTHLGNLQSLKQARFYKNHFEGTVPDEVCDLTTDEELTYLGADCSRGLTCTCCTKCY